jgi:hypothetical protein
LGGISDVTGDFVYARPQKGEDSIKIAYRTAAASGECECSSIAA